MAPKRPRPRDLVARWPEVASEDVAAEVARRIALSLTDAMGARSLREISDITGVDHTTIADVLRGNRWSDIATIARLEGGLGVALWPVRLASGAAQS